MTPPFESFLLNLPVFQIMHFNINGVELCNLNFLIPKHLKRGINFQLMPPSFEHDLYFNTDEIYEACFISLIYYNIATFMLKMIGVGLHLKSLIYTYE